MKYRVLHVPDRHTALVIRVHDDHLLFRSRVFSTCGGTNTKGLQTLLVMPTRERAEGLARLLLSIQDEQEKKLHDNHGKRPDYNKAQS